MASTNSPNTSQMNYTVKEEFAESCAETFVETFPPVHLKEDGSSITATADVFNTMEKDSFETLSEYFHPIHMKEEIPSSMAADSFDPVEEFNDGSSIMAAADVHNTITEDSAETLVENFHPVNVKKEYSSSGVSDASNPIKEFKDAAETFPDGFSETLADNFLPVNAKDEDSSSEVSYVYYPIEESKEATETFPDKFCPVHVAQNVSNSMAAELFEPEPGPSFPSISELSRNANIPDSNIKGIATTIVRKEKDHRFRNTERLELIVEEHNRGLISTEELLSPLVKEEHLETSTQGKVESDEEHGTVINTNKATSCERSHDSAPFSNGPSLIEMNNGIYSVTFLSEGTEFGPYPDASSTSVRSRTEEVDWPSSMRKSCGKEQHNIEAVRREGQIYYRTVTDIWPNAEIVLGDSIEHNMQPVTYTVPEKSHRCLVCKKQFGSSSDLKCHNMTHTGEKPHQCPVCKKQFATSGNLTQHNMTHTGEKPHKCQECGKDFASSSNLKQHYMTHTGEKPHKCLVCGKQFALKNHLKLHIKTHTGYRPHGCQECGKHFLLMSDLKRHNVIHTGERPHKCQECGKQFALSSNLKQHNMIHTGEKSKPHKCPECGKVFASSMDLQRHNMTHTGEKPYQCPDCGKAFTRSDSLKRHHMIHTGEKKPH